MPNTSMLTLAGKKEADFTRAFGRTRNILSKMQPLELNKAEIVLEISVMPCYDYRFSDKPTFRIEVDVNA